MNSPPPFPAVSVCVIDDEASARRLLQGLLEPEGYRLMVFENGPQALEAVKHEPPDIVLLDVVMPGMDGFEVCRKIRADDRLRQVPIILLTSLDDRSSRLQGFEAGADDFVTKPIDALELRTRLGTISRLNRFRLLYEERERFRRAISLSPDAIIVTRPDGEVLYANKASLRLLGVAGSNSLATTNLLDAFPPAKTKELKSQVESLTQGLTLRLDVVEATLLLPGSDGTQLEINVGLVPWQNEEAVQFTLRDVTDKKNLELQLLRSQRIEMVGQLASSLVHDLNNMLTGIRSSVALVDLKDSAKSQVHLKNIDGQAHRGAGMLRQLLLFARGTDGRMQLVYTDEVIGEAATIVQETFGPLYTVKLSFEGQLPDILADSTQLHQVMMNLCLNARDAMPAGGVLSLSATHAILTEDNLSTWGPQAKAGDYVALAVRDTGSGIAPEILPKLFQPFFTTKPPGKGTGLGLASVLRILRRHRGFVSVESKLGLGSCFTCFFPVATVEDSLGG